MSVPEIDRALVDATVPVPVRPEFPYLDGIRGLAALAVVVYHAFLFTGQSNEAEEAMPLIHAFVGWGYLGVPIFIVLSGYVLMLPTLAHGLRFRGGTWRFIKRRSRRILPPYYSALALSLMLILFVPAMGRLGGTQWDSKLPVTWPSVTAHLLMLQDLSGNWIGKINGPLWSVAIEWHIYFLMPLVLLPLWRHFSPSMIVSLVLGITLLPALVGVGTWAHPWLIGLFAVGMWSAASTVTGEQRSTSASGRLFALFLALLVLCMAQKIVYDSIPVGLVETATGLTVGAGLAWVGRRQQAGAPVWLIKPLQSRPLKTLGLFSYSIYLLHSPLLALANLLLLPIAMPIEARWALMTFVVAPVAVGVCYGFFRLVESHFLNSRQRHAEMELTVTPPHQPT